MLESKIKKNTFSYFYHLLWHNTNKKKEAKATKVTDTVAVIFENKFHYVNAA